MDAIVGLLAIVLLVGANGFFVAAEFALVSARRTRLDQLAAQGSTAAKAAQRASDHLDSYIAATQLGITVASLALGWIGEPAVVQLLDPLLQLIHAAWLTAISHNLSIIVAFAFVTVFHIVLGELTPKSIALERPEGVALFVARPIGWFYAIFRPVIVVMNALTGLVVHGLGIETATEQSHVHSPEELAMLVHSTREAGLLEDSEEELLKRAFDFSDLHIQQVMRPRTEVDAIAIDMPLKELLAQITTLRHSRYPVYKDTMDTVIGLLHTKDLLDALIKRPTLLTDGGRAFELKSILRMPLFVPQTTGADTVLDQMQRRKMPFAIVVDEYGGMAGIATTEDILEELVGEMQDEFDFEANPIETRGDVTLVDGLVSMDDIIERFGDSGQPYTMTTIGGYVAEILDRIPAVGNTVTFGDYDMRVEAMDGMRVSKVRFIKRQPEAAPPPPVTPSPEQEG